MLSSGDQDYLNQKGISADSFLQQIDRFKQGFASIKLDRAATVGDGVLSLSDQEQKEAVERFEAFDGSVAKFVPASGAATRMFKALYAYRDKVNEPEGETLKELPEEVGLFFEKLSSFGFYEELSAVFEQKNGRSLSSAVKEGHLVEILNSLLDKEGMNYGNAPKGLLSFHKARMGPRTPALEQLAEGHLHLPKKSKLHLHFTVSPEFRDSFESHVKEHLENDKTRLSFSGQEPATDTVAVDLDNGVIRESSGNMLFRPAGHGALLQNLNKIEEDLIFVKNIDNVLPDRLKDQVVLFKKVLAGVLLKFQSQLFDLLNRYHKGAEVKAEMQALLRRLGVDNELPIEKVVQKLQRPLRVCGMVKNVGEPGGGPFWVMGANGEITTQIVEKAQVRLDDANQKQIFEESTHFNPVDIVCGVRNGSGEKYDLLEYRDEETGFITEKSFGGKKLKAMELPGLWNGAMADWNTVFVEVPLDTFSPVKTVNDLLKPEHQPTETKPK